MGGQFRKNISPLNGLFEIKQSACLLTYTYLSYHGTGRITPDNKTEIIFEHSKPTHETASRLVRLAGKQVKKVMKKAIVVFTLWAVFAAFIGAGQSLNPALLRLPIQFGNTSTQYLGNAVFQSILTDVFGVVYRLGSRLQRHALGSPSCFSFARRVTFGTGWVFIDSQSEVAEAAFDFMQYRQVATEFQDSKGGQLFLEFWESG